MDEKNDDNDDKDDGKRHVFVLVMGLMVFSTLLYTFGFRARTIFTCRHPLNVVSLCRIRVPERGDVFRLQDEVELW